MTSGHHILEGHECVVQDSSYKPCQQTTVTTASKKILAERSKYSSLIRERVCNSESGDSGEHFQYRERKEKGKEGPQAAS